MEASLPNRLRQFARLISDTFTVGAHRVPRSRELPTHRTHRTRNSAPSLSHATQALSDHNPRPPLLLLPTHLPQPSNFSRTLSFDWALTAGHPSTPTSTRDEGTHPLDSILPSFARSEQVSCAHMPKRRYVDAQGRADIPAPLSGDILATVCDLLESPPFTKRTALLKHKKNQTILALSHVCRSWYRQITGCKSIFRDIAFDVSSEESIVTAGVFLKILERTTVPINVHASLGQSCDPDPMLTRLFTQLRPHSQHIVHFEYNGDMARYCGYLDLPAPNLLFFSDSFDTYPGSGPPLFCGQMPRLRVLTTLSLASRIVWATSTLSDLTILNLGFLDSEPYIPLGSFLNLLRGSPCLESVNVLRFTPVISHNEDLRDIFLPRLHTLNLVHNKFHAIVKHLRIPNVRKLYFCGESHAPQRVGVNPTFEAQHLFTELPILPIFERPIEHVLLKTTGNGTACADFHLHLVADGGFVLRVSLFWILDAVSSLRTARVNIPQKNMHLALQ